MPDRVSEDVAVVRQTLDAMAYQGPWLRSEAYAALDRLQARLEAAEAERDAESRSAWANAIDRDKFLAKRDKAQADAERLAEALRWIRDHRGFPPASGAREALAAHEEGE